MIIHQNATLSLEWKFQKEKVAYDHALVWMEKRVKEIQEGTQNPCIWFLEHPPLYTIGNQGQKNHILTPRKIPAFHTRRGGQVTYHGPGQRVIYLMMDLKKWQKDIKLYIRTLEEWIIQTLFEFGITGERREGRVGIWVQKEGYDHKIAAFGVRMQKWVTSHGLALNVHPDLTAYQDIIPCGLKDVGVTSFSDMGLSVSLEEVDQVLQKTFPFPQ